MKTLILILSLFLCFNLNAQYKLVFAKKDSTKTVVIEQKDLVRLSYNGYMNQHQEAEGYVSGFTDSTITLLPRKQLFKKQVNGQILSIKDITGFRHYSNFRPTGEIIYSFLSIGITGTVTAIISNASVPPELSFLSAAGTQTVTTVMKNVFFSSKIKNQVKEEWTMQLVKSN